MWCTRHDDASEDVQAIPAPDVLQGSLESQTRSIVVEECETAVTTEGEEVIAAEVLVALESGGHMERVTPTVIGAM